MVGFNDPTRPRKKGSRNYLFSLRRYLKTSESSPSQPEFRHETCITSFDTYGFHGIPWPPSTLGVNPWSPNSSAMPRGVWSRNCNPSSLDVSCGWNSRGNRVTCLAFATLMVPENDGRTNDDMDVSKNSGTPKSSILVRFSIIILRYPYFWKHPYEKHIFNQIRTLMA